MGDLARALQARWGEIDLAKKPWTSRTARMKKNHKHVAPLPSLALAILEQQAKVRAGDAVFPGPRCSPLNYSPCQSSRRDRKPHGTRPAARL